MSWLQPKEVCAQIIVGCKSWEFSFGKSDQFAPELVYFSDCILHNREPEPSGEEGLADVGIIRVLYESLAKGKPVPIRAAAPVKRPSSDQEIRRPPVRNPISFTPKAPAPTSSGKLGRPATTGDVVKR